MKENQNSGTTERTDLAEALDQLLASAPAQSETASALVELAEHAERAYRAAVVAAQPRGAVAARTDLIHPI